VRQASFNDLIDEWFEADCPNAAPTSTCRLNRDHVVLSRD
jgi:hypothetical protein